MSVFRFILLTLAAYRLTRLVTTDQWPPTKWLRRTVDKKYGPNSFWAELINCPWCLSAWLCPVIFAIDHYFWSPPFWLLASVAATALVGYLGTWDERN